MCPLCDNTGYKKVYYDYGALCICIFGKLLYDEELEQLPDAEGKDA